MTSSETGGTSPLFSVIVPVYQCEESLSACVESVLAQDSEGLEIVLVDDGSTDGSAALCDAYGFKHPAVVTVVHKRNEGPLAARLDGIRASRGTYLLFLDADDRFAPNLLHAVADAIEADRPDLLVMNYVRVHADGTVALETPLCADGTVFEGDGLEALRREVVVGPRLNALWMKCVRRDLLTDLDFIRPYERLIIGEDKLLSLEIVDRAQRAVYLAEGLYEYRLSDESLSHKLGLRHFRDMELVLTEARRYGELWGVVGASGLTSRSLVEFGLSCLVSLARRVPFSDAAPQELAELVEHLRHDEKYWRAYASCRDQLPLPRRVVCWMVRRGWVMPLFVLLKAAMRARA